MLAYPISYPVVALYTYLDKEALENLILMIDYADKSLLLATGS